VAWPFHYLDRGHARAVLGCGDPMARRFMKPDEMAFTVPYALYRSLLSRWRESFLSTGAWGSIQKKIAQSAEVWGDRPVPTQAASTRFPHGKIGINIFK
jgi:hypothetical protein